jgi:hypothetical protein
MKMDQSKLLSIRNGLKKNEQEILKLLGLNNAFICDECLCIVNFSGNGEAATCCICDQFDLGDGCKYCLECFEKSYSNKLCCKKCKMYICKDCYEKNDICFDCQC